MSSSTAGSRAIVAGFALLLGAAWLVPGPQLDENREEAAWPRPSRATVADATFFRDTDLAFAAHLALKGVVVRAVSGAVVGVGLSPSADVLRGGDGRAYYAGDFTAPCWTLPSISDSRDAIRGLNDRLNASGTTFVYAIVPDKSSIEPDRVGWLAERLTTCSEPSREFWAATAADEPMIFTTWDEFEAASAAGDELYRFTDSHWNYRGAALYSELLLEHLAELGAAPAGLEPATEVREAGEVELVGDLFRLMGAESAETITRLVVERPGVTTTMTETDGVQHWVSTSTSAPLIGGRTLILRDSMFYTNGELLAPYFADLTTMHSKDAAAGAATIEPGYDLVIIQQVQRSVPAYLEQVVDAPWLTR